ncbi:hypothetical protein CRG98_029974 [Punica granatum]|uniref:Uncharacterized protein n=1 Tax=Punica granatum TaxID=22663 RepID=A0A2I0J054_PUNGR|nr:hypothetical protein CRG98_029974 [Punica granatum]
MVGGGCHCERGREQTVWPSREGCFLTQTKDIAYFNLGLEWAPGYVAGFCWTGRQGRGGGAPNVPSTPRRFLRERVAAGDLWINKSIFFGDSVGLGASFGNAQVLVGTSRLSLHRVD